MALSVAVPADGKLLDIATGAIAVGGAVVAFGVVAFLLDRGDLRTVLDRVRRAVRSRSAG